MSTAPVLESPLNFGPHLGPMEAHAKLPAGPSGREKIVPSATLAALDQAVHLWTLPALDATVTTSLADLNTLLSDDEHARAHSFYVSAHREAFIANRGRLRVVLAHYLDCRPEALRFVQGAHGKPELADQYSHEGHGQENNHQENNGQASHGLTFNLSHTDGLAVLAVTRGRQVGVDVEQLRAIPDLLDVARPHFSTSEYEQLAALPAAEKLHAFYTCWTRKEAFLKGLGTGLARNLAEFQVSFLPGAPAALLACQWSPALCQTWRLHSLETGDGYAGALAYEQTLHHASLDLQTFTWSAVDISDRGQ